MGSSCLRIAMTVAVALFALLGSVIGTLPPRIAASSRTASLDRSPAASLRTATPIKHLVVIFQENASFDHYFATYPHALNLPGEPRFDAPRGTAKVNGLAGDLLTHNPNLRQPFRLTRAEAVTCDMDHTYYAEQRAYDQGHLDRFVQWTQGPKVNAAQYCPRGVVMGYYDGNTVTALWNYAMHFAMDDNAHGTTFGPSTVGALNLIAADTAGAVCARYQPYGFQYGLRACSWTIAPTRIGGKQPRTVALHTDVAPYYDDCSVGGPHDKHLTAALITPNIGDLLTAAHITWGWFAGSFDNCWTSHPHVAYDTQVAHVNPATDRWVQPDYDPHQEPFQFFATTANPHHRRPARTDMIGQSDQANHQYDLKDFWAAVAVGSLPAVSFLKAPGYETGHPGYSDPLDEQTFLVDTINRIEGLPTWPMTAIIVTYDDSDGWYDHDPGKIVNHSATPFDYRCGPTSDGVPGRCGYGPRLPYLVISPYARTGVVDHALIDQTSTVQFIENNWLHSERISNESFDRRAGSIDGMFDFHAQGRRSPRLFLAPRTGLLLATPAAQPAAAHTVPLSPSRATSVRYLGAGDP